MAANAAEHREHGQVVQAAARAGKRTWSEALGRFAAGLQTKRQRSKVAAFTEGALLDREIDADLPGQVEAHSATIAKNDAAYESRRALVQACLQRGQGCRVNFQNLEAHFDADVTMSQDVRDVIAENSIRVLPGDQRLLAKAFVVKDVGQPSQRTS